MDNTAFPGIVTILAIVITVQLFSGPVGGSSDGRLTCAAFDLCRMEMKQCHIIHHPSQLQQL